MNTILSSGGLDKRVLGCPVHHQSPWVPWPPVLVLSSSLSRQSLTAWSCSSRPCHCNNHFQAFTLQLPPLSLQLIPWIQQAISPTRISVCEPTTCHCSSSSSRSHFPGMELTSLHHELSRVHILNPLTPVKITYQKTHWWLNPISYLLSTCPRAAEYMAREITHPLSLVSSGPSAC